MKEIEFEILGKPIHKKRPRFKKWGPKKAYNPQKPEEARWVLEVRTQITPEIQRWLPLTGPIFLKLTFLMPLSKEFSIAELKGLPTFALPYMHTPDLDNLIKFVKDCCNVWLWKDDRQVYHVDALKIYGKEPMTLVHVIEMGAGR